MSQEKTRNAWLAILLFAITLTGCDRTPSDATLSSETPDTRSSAASGGAEAGRPSAEGLARALAEPDAYRRTARIAALLAEDRAARAGQGASEAGSSDELLVAIRETLRRYPVELGASEFDLFVRYWAERAPQESLDWVARYASPLYRPASVRTIVESWAARDPTAALVAIEVPAIMGTNEIARAAQVALVQGWFRKDRGEVEDFIVGLGAGIHQERALFSFLLALASSDGGEAVVRWAEAIPDDQERFKKASYRQAMSALVWHDKAAAERFCDAHCDGPHGKGMRNVVIRARLVAGDPGDEVVEWVAAVPEQDPEQIANKHHSLWVAYSTWAYRQREQALAWMKAALAADEPSRPAWLPVLYAEYARQLAIETPAEAIPWAEKIEEESERERALIRIVRAWRARDPEAADAWLEGSSLSQAARAEARRAAPPRANPAPPG